MCCFTSAGPPPSTPEEALRLLAAAGWEDNTGTAMQLALLEKSKRIESERQRQDLADRWAYVAVAVSFLPVTGSNDRLLCTLSLIVHNT